MEGLSLTSGQRRRLRAHLQHADEARAFRRVLAILEVSEGKAIAEVARTLGVTRQSVYNWVARDVRVLRDAPRSGRPRLWTAESQAALQALLEVSPERFGYPGANWTVPMLQEQLARGLGKRYSDDTVRRGLQGLGYVWKRSRYVLEPDPERGEKGAPDSAPSEGTGGPQRAAGGG